MTAVCQRCGAEIQEPSSPGNGHSCSALTDGDGTSAASAPASTSTPVAPPTPAAAPPSAPQAGDDAWTALLERWDDAEAHRAFLAGFTDLPGLAGAGRRYRQVLSERPDDAMALRWRDEILKRAMVQGLAQLPRTTPPRARPQVVRWAVLAGMIGAAALVAAWMVSRIVGLARG